MSTAPPRHRATIGWGQNPGKASVYGDVGTGRFAWRMFLDDDRGGEQTEYRLRAAVVLPSIAAVRLMWVVLLQYVSVAALMLDLPLF